MKINWCKVITAAYHMVFAGGMFTGGEYYLTEIRKIESNIVHQIDRVEEMSQSATALVVSTTATIHSSTSKVTGSVDKTVNQIKSIEQSVKKLQKACTGGLF